MRWGKLEVSGGFLLLLSLCNYLDHQGMVPLVILACIIHELGHYIAMLLLGGRLRIIRLTVVGAEMMMQGTLSYEKELIIALAGPIFNLLIALFCCHWVVWDCFAGINLMLACFNLLPATRLDGGRSLYCILVIFMGEHQAIEIGSICDSVFRCIILLFGGISIWFGGGFTLFIIGAWLIIGQNREKGLVI